MEFALLTGCFFDFAVRPGFFFAPVFLAPPAAARVFSRDCEPAVGSAADSDDADCSGLGGGTVPAAVDRVLGVLRTLSNCYQNRSLARRSFASRFCKGCATRSRCGSLADATLRRWVFRNSDVGGFVPRFQVETLGSAFRGTIVIGLLSWLCGKFFPGCGGRVHVLTQHTQRKRLRGCIVEPDQRA